MNRDYLTVADILGMHAILIEKYGGMAGIRDMGGLESAAYRPQSGYYSDIVEEACALMESLLINHPFIDGNKRTAFAACSVFLRINGQHITADSNKLFMLIIRWLQLPPTERFRTMTNDLRNLVKIQNKPKQ
ncbi:Death-on-curing family protein [uncultured Desulfovibrio sp.]|uniref:Death-on-curing family protein n=1 Tax=uncultured Desulfovibrio sp. TaxID=167968 RepID=A0A212J715_9BACT|nr:type II toxin-antitoxin system death-on-curing family toxin [uncultured Desulfovibrio sp.]SBV95218.1 Death-on-curing family protein [uncultured Desulfovibrio sp.]